VDWGVLGRACSEYGGGMIYCNTCLVDWQWQDMQSTGVLKTIFFVGGDGRGTGV
jgi:hypothetical protein